MQKMATKSSKKEKIHFMPALDKIGIGQEWYGNRPGMRQVRFKNGPGTGEVWDGMIQVDFMHMAHFFCFPIHFCQKVPMSGVHAPHNGSTPPMGNPGSATE